MTSGLRFFLGMLLSLCLCACGQQQARQLSLVSGSENKSLESLVKQLGRKHGVDIAITYLGSVDMARELEKGTACPYDAVWPASSLWLALGGTRRVVKHSQSTMRSPVVFAVKKVVLGSERWGAFVRDLDDFHDFFM